MELERLAPDLIALWKAAEDVYTRYDTPGDYAAFVRSTVELREAVRALREVKL